MMPEYPPATSREQGRRLEEKFSSLAEPILGGAKTRDLLARSDGSNNWAICDL